MPQEAYGLYVTRVRPINKRIFRFNPVTRQYVVFALNTLRVFKARYYVWTKIFQMSSFCQRLLEEAKKVGFNSGQARKARKRKRQAKLKHRIH